MYVFNAAVSSNVCELVHDHYKYYCMKKCKNTLYVFCSLQQLHTLNTKTPPVPISYCDYNIFTIIVFFSIFQAVIWDTKTFVLLRKLEGHYHDVCSADFSSDGALVVTSSYDTRAIVWDPHTGDPLFEFW